MAELGGKSANIVFDDADLDHAAMLSAHQGPLMQSGQSCACASRVLVHDSVYDAFVEKFLARHRFRQGRRPASTPPSRSAP